MTARAVGYDDDVCVWGEVVGVCLELLDVLVWVGCVCVCISVYLYYSVCILCILFVRLAVPCVSNAWLEF